MKTTLLTTVILFLFINVYAQTYQIGHTTVTFTDSSRNNRNIETEIYYPSDTDGDNVPVTILNTDKFPVLSFGHGFVMGWDAYENIWTALVPEGFIIAFPKTEGSLAPSHDEFGKDLAFVISQLNLLGQDASSLLFNRVDTMNCVMGHSMGGGAAFIAAEFSSEIKSLLTFAPAETNPSAILAATNVSVPSLVIAGGNDCVTPQATNQQPMYDSLQSTCKAYISITGGSHCQMADPNFLCSFGEITCSPSPAITRAEQHTVINRYIIPWLNFQLKNDCASGVQFDSLIIADTAITFQKTCTLCFTTSHNELEFINDISIYPNPFGSSVFIKSNSETKNISAEIYHLDGRLVYSEIVSNNKSEDVIELSIAKNIPQGIYLLAIEIDGIKIAKKIIKY